MGSGSEWGYLLQIEEAAAGPGCGGPEGMGPSSHQSRAGLMEIRGSLSVYLKQIVFLLQYPENWQASCPGPSREWLGNYCFFVNTGH